MWHKYITSLYKLSVWSKMQSFSVQGRRNTKLCGDPQQFKSRNICIIPTESTLQKGLALHKLFNGLKNIYQMFWWHQSFCWATDAPVLHLWWHLPGFQTNSSDSPLVQHLLTSCWPVWLLCSFDPRTCVQALLSLVFRNESILTYALSNKRDIILDIACEKMKNTNPTDTNVN